MMSWCLRLDTDKADDIAKLITNAMQDVLTVTAADKGWQVDFAVPLLIEIGVGKNWDEAH